MTREDETETRIDNLEQRVADLEFRVIRPSPEECRAWVMAHYGSMKGCAEILGLNANYISQVCSGRKRPSDTIVNRMIKDGFHLSLK